MSKQEKFDKLVCIASTLNSVLKASTNTKRVGVEIYKDGDIDRVEMMSLDEIENYIDSIFEMDIR